MRRNTALNRDFSRHCFPIAIPPHGKESRWISVANRTKFLLPQSCDITGIHATGKTCLPAEYRLGTMPWLHLSSIPHEHIRTSMWFGDSRGRHFIHSELKWDKRHPPSKLSCFQKELHGSQRAPFTTIHLHQPHVTGWKQPLWWTTASSSQQFWLQKI